MPDTTTRAPFSLRIRVAAWVIVVVVALGIAELAARLVFPLPEITNLDRTTYSPQQGAGRTSLAHASFRFESAPDNASSLHELNLYGFRDVEWPLARTRSRRVLFLGDSMVEGFLAERDETIPRVFERLARQNGDDIQVWNLGFGAAGLREYVELVQDAVPAFAPNVVVLVLHANDLLGSPTFAPDMIKPDFSPRHEPWYRLRLVAVAGRLMRGETVPRAWHAAPFSFLPAVPNPANPWMANGAAFDAYVAPDIAMAMRQGRFNPFVVAEVQVYAQHLSAPVDIAPWFVFLKDFLDRRGVRLRIAYIPNPGQATDYYLPFKQRFCPPGAPSMSGERYQTQAAVAAAAARNLGIDFVDLTPAIREAESRGQHLYWNYDEHLRPAGYAFVAHALYDRWRSGIDAAAR